MDIKFNGKILVADDEKINVEFFQIMLERLGFEVEVAYNGEEVIKKVEHFYPDIILLDLLMPKMSGIEVTKLLKSNPKTESIPIIILTAIDDIKEKVDLFEIGVEDYITKPFNFIEILARIRGILKTRRFKQLATTNEKKIETLENYFKESGKLIDSFNNALAEYSSGLKQNLMQSESSVALEKLIKGLEKIKNELNVLYKNVNEEIEIH